MNKHFFPLFIVCVLLSACGFKGDLYLPKEGDKARFGVIQTGLPLKSPASSSSSQPQSESK